MGIYLHNMEMPKEGNWRSIRIHPDGTIGRPIGFGDYALVEGAKAVPVPPHGRLIDADALVEHKFVCVPHVTVNGEEAGAAYRLGWNTAIEAIMENAETVIGGE